MSWAVTWDVGERGPAMNLSVFKWLQNIQTKRFFNTVKRTGPCLGEHGPAINLNVFETLYTIQKKMFSTPWKQLGCVWGNTTSRSFERCWKSAQHQNEKIPQRRKMSLAVTRDVGQRGPAINWKVFTWLHNIRRKSFSTPWKELGRVLGEHGPAISSNVFE